MLKSTTMGHARENSVSNSRADDVSYRDSYLDRDYYVL